MNIYFHIDLDAFFASVEILDNPELKNKPVIIGASPGHRGVVSTCSYEARKYGVYSSMPINEAYRRCPNGVFLPVRMDRYSEMSAKVMSVYEEFTPDVIIVSIDEASLDMTGTEKLYGPCIEAARLIKKRVLEKTGLTVSVGISQNRYVAKIASGIEKPDGLLYICPGTEENFMRSLPLKELWGVGKKTRAVLESLGLSSIEKIHSVSKDCLEGKFGKACGTFIYNAVRGLDSGIYTRDAKTKSISTETTFSDDISDLEILENKLLYMSEELQTRIFNENKKENKDECAFCVSIKLRYDNFETISIQETSREGFSNSIEIYKKAKELFNKKWNHNAIRLIGLSLSSFGKHCVTNDLFRSSEDKLSKLEKAALEAESRGLGKITKASLISKKKD